MVNRNEMNKKCSKKKKKRNDNMNESWVLFSFLFSFFCRIRRRRKKMNRIIIEKGGIDFDVNAFKIVPNGATSLKCSNGFYPLSVAMRSLLCSICLLESSSLFILFFFSFHLSLFAALHLSYQLYIFSHIKSREEQKKKNKKKKT